MLGVVSEKVMKVLRGHSLEGITNKSFMFCSVAETENFGT
jgi:hypothetical protein